MSRHASKLDLPSDIDVADNPFLKHYVTTPPRTATNTSQSVLDMIARHKAANALPDTYDFGMNCFLDTVESPIRQAVYEELKRIDGLSLSPNPNVLFGVTSIHHCLKAYNEVAVRTMGGHRRALELNKTEFIRLWLEYIEPNKNQLRQIDDDVNRLTAIVDVDSVNRHAITLHDIDFALRSEHFFTVATAHYQAGRYRDALYAYDKATRAEPLDARAWNGKGATLSSLGQHKPALECFDRALDIAPRLNGGEIWLNKARALNRLERHDDQIACLDEAEAISSDILDNHMTALPASAVVIWADKAVALSKLGKYNNGLRYLDWALEVSQNDTTLLGNTTV